MASSSTNLSLPSSSSTHRRKYDVFLSFRGEDTRQNFTAHLYEALCREGIDTFKDSLLTRGEKISPALLQAIEESRFSIIIFSENYASSSWCLDELTKILECVEEGGHTALPVFHNVDPSHVRKQRRSFAEAFEEHEQVYREKMEKVVKWRKALTEAAKISGWDSRNKDESEVIEEIVTRILTDRTGASSSNMDGLVGMDSRIEDVVSRLCIGSDDARIVGIWGMAGIGKTSIAKAVYKRICAEFEGCCFLGNVREDSQRYGLTYLEEKLFSTILGKQTKNFNTEINFVKARLHSKKVFIVLDDVHKEEQLQALAGDHDWFGQGSRIIITTRDQGLLNRVDAIYEVKELVYDEAHKLFCWYAFKHNPITEDYMQLCNHAVNYIKGLPLALIVLGSFLCNKDIDEWKSALDKLKKIPHEDVYMKLKISFDGLDRTQKKIFLDIACFFKDKDKSFVEEILESCDLFPIINIKVLIDKSLITVSNNKLCMHDLLQAMGWEIVRQEDVEYFGNRSRLWVHDEVNDVLINNKFVQGIVFDLSISDELNLNVDAFAKMRNLRLLRFHYFGFSGCSEYLSRKELIACNDPEAWRWWYYEMYRGLHNDSKFTKLHLSGDFKFPSNNLRSLYWHGYPLKSLPSNFHPNKLVELNLRSSQLEQLWEGNKRLEKLKFINLSHSQHLTKVPDFSGAPNLRRLILKGCTSLAEVHPSIGALNHLIFLNLEGCKKLEKFPEVQGNNEHLTEISLEGTAIKGLPSSIENLTGLALLNLKECKRLKSLPRSIFRLQSLKTLILSNCARLEKLPEMLEDMESLKELFLGGSGIREVPSSIGHLKGLVLLNLSYCKKLASLPQSICELTSLRTLTLPDCSELKELSDELEILQCLVQLNADGTAIRKMASPSTNLLSNIQELSFAGYKGGESFRLPSWCSLTSLKKLNLSDCNLLEGALLLSDLSSLSSLEHLDLSRNNFITLPASLSRLPQLIRLRLEFCKSLQSLSELPSSIERLEANYCTSLKTFSYPSGAYALRKSERVRFEFSNCLQLVKNEESDIVEAILLGIRLVASVPKYLDADKVFLSRDNGYDATLPGSNIPEWFIHQSMGSSVTVELPPHWYNTKLMGLAVCAVVSANPAVPPLEVYPGSVFFILGENDGFYVDHAASLNFSLKADHVWFGYRSLRGLTYWDKNKVRKQGNTLKVSFATSPCVHGNLKVKKCGVRVVNEEDENDGECSFPYARMLPRGDESE